MKQNFKTTEQTCLLVLMKIRIPPWIKDLLDEEIKKSGRTRSEEIVHRLKLSFEHESK